MQVSSITVLSAPGIVIAINNNGQILSENMTGFSDPSTETFSLYLQSGGAITTIGTYGGMYEGAVLNNSGMVAWEGASVAAGTGITTDYSYVWQNGQATQIPLVNGQFTPRATAIDDSGRVYGYSQINGQYSGGFPPDWVYQKGSLSILPAYAPTPGVGQVPFEFISGNANGDLAGQGSNTSTASGVLTQAHLWLWKSGNMVDFGAIPSAFIAIDPYAVNASDQIVGAEQITYGISKGSAFLAQNGGILQLPTLGPDYAYNYAYSINDQGIVVGSSGKSLSDSVAVAWQNGTVTNLNSLLPANSGWVLTQARGINDSGQVIGYGTYNGAAANFELTLTPQSYTAFAAAAVLHTGQLFSITPISDSAAGISANLDDLQAIAKAGELGKISLTDAGTAVLSVTEAQLTSDSAALQAISGSFTYQVEDKAVTIGDNLDSLQSLAANGKLSTINLTDGGIPTLSLTSAQLSADAAAIKDISSAFALSVSAPAGSTVLSGVSGHATTIVFSGMGAEYSITPTGNGSGFTISGNGVADRISNVQALQFADHTDIVASQTPPSPGAVSTAQVTELYSAVLGRTPDVAGLSFYQSFAAANPSTPFLQFAEWFLASPEYAGNKAHAYAQTVAGDQQFIADSYNNLLHRTPSTDEVAYYENGVIAPALAGLTAGTPAYMTADMKAHALVLAYFSQSPEFLNDVTVTAQNPTSASHWLVLI